jgi:(p)ppGpp synthase/HD superfamily hydrolase
LKQSEKARVFALAAHGAIDHRRKYSGVPYFQHVENVALLIRSANLPDEAVAAGFLHDVVEDTHITMDMIRGEFDPLVAQLVWELTDISKPEDGNRKFRKQLDRQHIAEASWLGKSCKLADLIDNAVDISKHDPNFAVVYMREKKALLEVLKDGNEFLYNHAALIVENYYDDNPRHRRDYEQTHC